MWYNKKAVAGEAGSDCILKSEQYQARKGKELEPLLIPDWEAECGRLYEADW